MDKQIENKIEPWWNKPLWGDKSMLEKIESIIHKPHDIVPQEVIDHHQRVFGELKLLTPIGKALDSDKFSNLEFLEFVKISSLFANEIGEYKGLRNYVALFRVAVEAKNSFLKIEQIELSYRSSKQQQFYNFVFNLLEKQLSSEEFVISLEEKLAQILSEIQTEEGKNALNIYAETFKTVARQDDLGLKLIFLFKKYQLEDFSLLRVMSDMVQYLLDRDLGDFNDIVILVKANQKRFEQLGKIIELPLDKTRDEDYARMLQYIAMKQKHQVSYGQFQRLLEMMTQWTHFYLIIRDIRSHYSESEFTLPPEFKQSIPGLDIYLKYKTFLVK
ncbi:hypothetical protein [Geminocystis sp. NIES-3709]|uniref:hypothetical protein n=1 Tax=Geminocystis sp. NIES-3709 TaxID=1617448 RepID=UPI0005FC4C25|nr:hypothetical protein [Geminocystis sp. NIES-3709]BAQ63861.1 hypothetical protein GM3709_626 [Geminocystis sp. NIES-3709]